MTPVRSAASRAATCLAACSLHRRLQVTQGQAAPKALAVEVTYHPAVSMAAGGPLLEELAGRIAASLGPPPPGAPAGT